MGFVDIFSNKKIEEKKTNIIADNREKNSLVISELINQNNIVKFEQLIIGDYLINDLVIERKTKSDLISSIIDKRIFNQLENLKKYPNYLLIIEENNFQLTIPENVIRGFIISTVVKSKVPIIFTKNEKDTAKYLGILANKKEKSNYSLRPSRNFLSNEKQAQYILEGFPNIGPIKAKELIKQFKSLKNISNASKEQLANILGKQSEEFYNLINQEL